MKSQKYTFNRKIKKILFYLLAALLGGCVPVITLYPLYTDKDVIFEEKLLGRWVDDDSNDVTWEFSRIDKKAKSKIMVEIPDDYEKAYKLIFTQKDKGENVKGLFIAHLVKLENKLFMDIYPATFPNLPDDPNDSNVGWPYNMFFFKPVHTFMKVEQIEPELKFWMTDDDKIKKLLKEDPNAIQVYDKDNTFLTAPTKQLQEFVLKYSDDKRLFCNETVLTRQRIADPNEPKKKDPNKG